MESVDFEESLGGSSTPTGEDDDDEDYYYSSSESTATPTPATVSTGNTDPWRKRRTSKKDDSIMIRRQLRELSSIVPARLNKILEDEDANSIVEDAIEYMKQLQDRVNTLQEQTNNHNNNDKRSQYANEEELPEVEVITDEEKNVLIRICCRKQKGYVSKIVREIEKMNLAVANISALPFGDYFLAITVSAQMGNEFCMTAKDIKRNLRLALLEFM